MKWLPWCEKILTRPATWCDNPRGLVLVEMLVALPMMFLIAALLFMFLWTGICAFDRLAQMEERQYYARTVMRAITDDIVEAQGVSIFNEGKGLNLSYPDGKSKRYYLDKQQIYRVSGESTVPLTEDTSLLVFSFLSPGVIQTEIIEGSGENSFRLLGACALRS